MGQDEDDWPFSTTLSFLSFKKSRRVLKTLPDYHWSKWWGSKNPLLEKLEFEKWCAICASVDGVGGVLVWVMCYRRCHGCVGGVLAWVACKCGSRTNLGYVVCVLAWITCQCGWCGWCVSVGKVFGVLAWVAWVVY